MITSKCFGKVMLAGEYSVLFGGRFLASTLTSSITIKIREIDKPIISVHSNIWDKPLEISKSETSSTQEPSTHIFSQFEKFNAYQKANGFEVSISPKDFEVSYGIGSSSAIRIAIIRGLNDLLGLDLDTSEISWLAYKDQKETQGKASGYDILTQVKTGLVGGVINNDRHAWPGDISSVAMPPDMLNKFSIFVGGRGAPTKQLVKAMLSHIEKNDLSTQIKSTSDNLIDILSSRECTFEQARDSIIALRKCFEATPAYPSRVAEALESVPGLDVVFTWKTTGAGGEDAILLFGNISQNLSTALNTIGYKKAPFDLTNSDI